MSRPIKKPDFDPDKLKEGLIAAVCHSYLNPSIGETPDKDPSHKQLKFLAEEFNMTPHKVRKLLVTEGVYSTDTSKLVQRLYASCDSIPEIMRKLQLSRSSVHSYLPYTKVVYKQSKISTDAERIKLFRMRQEAAKKLHDMPGTDNLWYAITLYSGYPFQTVKGVKFKYSVFGNELFVNRKEKSITRASVEVEYQKVIKHECKVTGPKKLGTYLYPMFLKFGIIENKELKKKDAQLDGRNDE
ncbi:hypothetical protein SAMN05443270_1977 [Lacrimispora sphenoides]|jgi:hypothetical protein|uniref:hypothetical protein n=1 Tax=Lacrimispora sphenoides TaxID=29370 RepID=UPI0008B1107C|nr:hypothetical protein [Lacrimispora sphenoides]SET90758.1 hypothetical protein SAMN05443270_1977 [Lacrimispora sphenoides]